MSVSLENLDQGICHSSRGTAHTYSSGTSCSHMHVFPDNSLPSLDATQQEANTRTSHTSKYGTPWLSDAKTKTYRMVLYILGEKSFGPVRSFMSGYFI